MVFFLLFQQDRNPDFMDLTEGELESKSKLAFEKCLDCRKERSSIGWCKDCEINAFKENFKNWTSENLKIDDFIKHTQLNAAGSMDYLECIDFNQLDFVKNVNKGGT